MKRYRIAGLAFILFFATFQVFAFFGNSLLGPNYCVVGCGRGPLGVAPLGDVIKGVNEFAFGPTLDAFEQKGKNIVDYASEKADAKILVLDKSLNDKVEQISEIAQDSISQLDTVLRTNIEFGIEGLSRQIDALDIVGTKQNDQLNALLRGIVFFVSISIMIIWLAKYVAVREGSLRSRLYQARWRGGVALAALVIILVAPNFIPGLKYRIPEIQKDLLKGYTAEFNNLSYRRSAYIADKLTALDPTNKDFFRKRDISIILREAYFNPVSYRVSDSLASTELKIASLLIPGDDSSRLHDEAVKFISEPDLEITFAMIVWQVRQNDSAHLQAANICAHVIERQLALAPENQARLLPLAVHYLKSYLINPIRDADVSMVKLEETELKPDVYSVNYPIKNVSELKAILAKASGTVFPKAKSAEAETLLRQIQFGGKVAEVYSASLPGYIQMLNLSFAAKTASPEAKKEIAAQRNQISEKIIKSWDSLLDDGGSRFFSDANLRLSLMTSLNAIYDRVGLYASSADFSLHPFISDEQYDKLATDKSFHRRWLKGMNGAIRPSGLPLLSFRTKVQFLIDQKSLYDFESSYFDFMSDTVNAEKAKLAAANAAKLGLFVCVNQSDMSELQSQKLVECGQAGAQQLNAVWYIRSLLPLEKRTTIEDWQTIFQTSLLRPATII